MVSKGVGYAIESLISVATVLIFVFGTLQIADTRDWDSFRRQVSADDLTYATQDSDYMNHALSEGEVGSIQTAFSTVSERNVEISGLVSNLPINENRVAFYTKPSRRHTQAISGIPPPGPDNCGGDLDEISTRSEEPVLRTVGGLYTSYNERLYLGDLDPNQVGGNNRQDYDSVWVDNGTKCQFAEDEGPYDIDDFIKWGPHNFDVERINASLGHMVLFNATQAVRFRDRLNKPVNDIDAFTSVDSVNFTEVGNADYNVLIIRTDKSVEDITGGKRVIVEDHLEDGSILVMADLSSDNFDNGDFLKDAGFKYIDVPYSGPYSGDPISGDFSSEQASQDTESYFLGFDGKRSSVSLRPPRVISNSEDTIQSTDSIFDSTEMYNYSHWDNGTRSMSSVDPALVDGEPDSDCYGTTSSSLTQGSLKFPDGNTYDFLNAELGTSVTHCNNRNTRAVMVDVDRDGNFTDADEGPFLNNGRVEIADRPYAVRIRFASVNPCNEGECIDFIYTGERNVELIPFRTNLNEVRGERIALSDHETFFEEEDRKVLSSTIHWLRGDQLAFTGRNEPGSISTSTYSGISNRTYIPYEVNLRWSR